MLEPWYGLDLKTAIYAVDRSGYNAIGHTVLMFPPIDNSFISGSDFEKHFKYCEFSKKQMDFRRINIWKNLGIPISLIPTGGHEVLFEGRKIFPYKFLFKHYPIRSQQHGENKLFNDRISRYPPSELEKGWHGQYKKTKEDSKFLRSPNELHLFDDTFYEKHLVELIAGLEIIG